MRLKTTNGYTSKMYKNMQFLSLKLKRGEY